MRNYCKEMFSNNHDEMTEIKSFWSWFGDNEEKVLILLKNKQYIELFEILDSKMSSRKDLGILLEFSEDQNGGYIMIITPEGNKNYFDLVRKIVNNAPKLNKIKPIAFRQKTGITEIEINNNIIDARNIIMVCIPDNTNNKIHIRVQHDEKINKDEFMTQIFIFLDHIIGEIDTEKYIGGINLVSDLSNHKDKIFSLAQFGTYVDSFKAELHTP